MPVRRAISQSLTPAEISVRTVLKSSKLRISVPLCAIPKLTATT